MNQQDVNWQHIRDHLAGMIRDGSLDGGAKIPTQQDLAAQFGTSRHIVRRALERMRAAGLIEGWQGRGYYVRRPEFSYEINDRTRFAASLRAAGAEIQIRLLRRYTRRAADPQIHEWLGIGAHERIPTGEILHLADGAPVGIGRHYFHPRRFDGILEAFCALRSAPEAFARQGLAHYTRSDTVIRTRLPSADEALALDIPRQQPVFRLCGRNVDGAGAPIEVTEAIARGDLINLAVAAPSSALGAKDL